MIFTDETGAQEYTVGDSFGSHVRFTDTHNTRWEIGRGEPHKVPLDDSDMSGSADG